MSYKKISVIFCSITNVEIRSNLIVVEVPTILCLFKISKWTLQVAQFWIFFFHLLTLHSYKMTGSMNMLLPSLYLNLLKLSWMKRISWILTHLPWYFFNTSTARCSLHYLVFAFPLFKFPSACKFRTRAVPCSCSSNICL